MTSHDPAQSRGLTGGGARAPASDETLKTEKLQVERKTFVFALKENSRGRFLRITEDVAGRRDTIIVPSTGLEEFRQLIDVMVKASSEIPAQSRQP
jgi:hypothetical protein